MFTLRATLFLLPNITWPVTPDDPLNITHDEYNLFDENAHQVWAYTGDDGWVAIGYLDKKSAAKIVGKAILSKQAITQGNGYEVSLKIEYEDRGQV